jgi:DNA-3-methyladenine glycosylase I
MLSGMAKDVSKDIKRCDWSFSDSLLQVYHDEEWGVPVHDDTKLFEFLILEGAQAGLSWLTILRRRENYRKAFDIFDIEKISNYKQGKIDQLLEDSSIIRNKLKIASTIQNAKCALSVIDEFGSLDKYFWSFVNGVPKKNKWRSMSHIPTTTKESEAMSKDLSKRGFRFVGSTICYSFMQATGMVNDHKVTCFRYKEV